MKNYYICVIRVRFVDGQHIELIRNSHPGNLIMLICSSFVIGSQLYIILKSCVNKACMSAISFIV